MLIQLNYDCGHSVKRDIDARYALNRRLVRRARAGDGVVDEHRDCPECIHRTIDLWIQGATAMELREVVYAHASNTSVRAKIFQIMNRGPGDAPAELRSAPVRRRR